MRTDEVEQPVYAFADDDIVEADAEMRGERRLEVVIVGVAIHPHVAARPPASRAITDGRRAEAALVGADARAEDRAARPLLRLRPDEGHGGGQGGDDRGLFRAQGHGSRFSYDG